MFAKKFLLSIRRLYLRFHKFISVSMCLLLFCNTAVFPAIVAGTIIKTSQGLVPIEALVIGSRVLSLKKDSLEEGSLVETEIVSIKEEEKKPIIGVKIEKETLFVEQDHLFYDSSINDWVKAKNLTDKSLLVDFEKNNHKCFGVESSCKDAKTYEVSLEKPNTFFIHKSQILVHNMVTIAAAGGVAAGTVGGGASAGSAFAGVIGAGVIVWVFIKGKAVPVFIKCISYTAKKFRGDPARRAFKKAAKEAAKLAYKNRGKVIDANTGKVLGYFCQKTGEYIDCSGDIVKTGAKAIGGAVVTVAKTTGKAVGNTVSGAVACAKAVGGTAFIVARCSAKFAGHFAMSGARIFGRVAVNATKGGAKIIVNVAEGVANSGVKAAKFGSNALKIGVVESVKAFGEVIRYLANTESCNGFGGSGGPSSSGGVVATNFGNGLRGAGRLFGDFIKKPFVRNTVRVTLGGAAVLGAMYCGGISTNWAPSGQGPTVNLSKNNNTLKPKKIEIENKVGAKSGAGNLGPDGNDPKDGKDGKKERVISKVTKTEFFERSEIEKDYGRYKDDVYRRKDRSKGLFKQAEYLEFDHTHNEVEVYNWSGDHLGAYDPVSNRMYKPAEKGRNIFKRK